MTTSVSALVDTTVGLPDGRHLAYACYGAAEGRPTYFLHGWPGSRIAGAPLDAAAKRAGVLLVVPDRPGVGGSDPLPGRSLLSFSEDLAALADHLEHPRFSLVGFSGGGPFALAVLHRLPERLLTRASDGGPAVALVSSQVPLSDPAARSLMPPHLQAIMALHHHAPLATRLSLGAMAMGLELAPDLMAQQLAHGLPEVDRRLLNELGLHGALGEEYREALRQGADGAAHEMSLFLEVWGFALEDLPKGILFFHGEDDANVPVILAKRLASELPEPVTHLMPGQGHFWLMGSAFEVFSSLE